MEAVCITELLEDPDFKDWRDRSRNRDRLHAVIGEPQTREQMITRALEIAIGTPEDFARYMHAEIERWGKVAREAGISLK